MLIIVVYSTHISSSDTLAMPKKISAPPESGRDRLVLNDAETVETADDLLSVQEEKPSFAELSSLVKHVVARSSWWDLHGVDLSLLTLAVAMFPLGFWLMASTVKAVFLAGLFITAYAHTMFTVKLAHETAHNALLGSSPTLNWALNVFCVEFCGGFTADGGYNIHVKMHHPYTNVIGLGDSSSWRVTFLDRFSYLFIAPNFIPIIFPFVSQTLIPNGYQTRVRLLICHMIGVFGYYSMLKHVSGLSTSAALVCVWLIRCIFAVPYIHVNIFQHIGLPMYSVSDRPSRLYQMATGVLNLNSNPVLDYCFGHSSISCHIEHHLFPRLSDNMCLKIKPVVRNYLKNHGLPYNEGLYSKLLAKFYKEYDKLIVQDPPVAKLRG